MCKPLEQDSTSLNFLIQAKEIFTSWRDSGNAGLTKETFLACIQSIGAMIELTSYLHRRHRLQYILPGKFMSDPIEARFRWYRQACGGNFFMSMRQSMLTEKKIRILTLLQQRILLQAARFSSDSMSVKTSHSDHNAAELIIFDEFSEHHVDSLDELSPADTNATYFVSGYIGRSICSRRKCSECKHLLLADKGNELSLDNHIPEGYKKLFDDADRGGLVGPSELCFAVTALAVQSYAAISSNEDMKNHVMLADNPRSLFVASLSQLVQSRPLYAPLFSKKCDKNHNNFALIVQCAFNFFSGNELKRINSRKNEPPAKMSRTARKLTGKTTLRNSTG